MTIYHQGDGKFDQPVEITRACPKCKAPKVKFRIWESSDGAFEDEQYECPQCHYIWWVDGIDS